MIIYIDIFKEIYFIIGCTVLVYCCNHVLIPRLKKSLDDKISSNTHGYIGVIMATLVIMSTIVGDIPIVVVYEKKMFGF
jgi:hypothetical protein